MPLSSVNSSPVRSGLPRLDRFAPTLLAAVLAACGGSAKSTVSTSPAPATMAAAPSPDPRIGLGAGWFDAGEAMWSMKVVSKTKPSAPFLNMSTPGDRRLVNSDLAFAGKYVFQGNYSGYQVWDVSNPASPKLADSYVCPGSQSDVTVYHNLMFVSAEATSGRTDCGIQGVKDTVSHERARGIRIFDITDVTKPKPITVVQTCRGSHTNTLVTDPADKANVYIYVSGSSPVRSSSELAGCSGLTPDKDPNSALFRIEVIQVPLAHPEEAKIVSSPRIFADASGKAEGIIALPRHGESPADSALQAAAMAKAGITPAQMAARPRGVTQCHDITTYPAVGLAGGACSGAGMLLDIRDVKNPKRVDVALDPNFSAWHSATFSNDGSKVLFSDEWGGGGQPRCRATDNVKWGADAIFTITPDKKMELQSYYKLPAPQSSVENCVSHNGSLIPIPGRDVMVQAWYQGGISVFDWTDPKHAYEIGYYDMGPMDAKELVGGGYWSVYWYNGLIYGSEESRGLHIFALTPGPNLTQNEIDAANLIKLDQLNVQEQPKFTWPAHFSVARAYLDQIGRSNGLPTARQAAIKSALDGAQKQSGAAQKSSLTLLATQLDADATTSGDKTKVKMLSDVVKELASAAK